MSKEKNQEVFYTGALPDPVDKRDYSYDELVAAKAPVTIDWEKGFDIRDVLGSDIEIKDQGSSSSCVGQGWSYYEWVLQVIELMKKYKVTFDQLKNLHPADVDQVSAKAVYSQIALKDGGAHIRSGANLIVDWGALFEAQVPSYKDGKTPDEAFMKDKSWKTAKMDDLAKALKGKEYRTIMASRNMDLYAQAILENLGVVGGVCGTNGSGWNTERPKPPAPNTDPQKIWGHCLYFGAFGQDKYGKYIATPNSWGERSWNKNYKWKKGDQPGAGWQKLYIDYFEGGNNFNPWTYVDVPNEENIPFDIVEWHKENGLVTQYNPNPTPAQLLGTVLWLTYKILKKVKNNEVQDMDFPK
jgi:hypothetical protein